MPAAPPAAIEANDPRFYPRGEAYLRRFLAHLIDIALIRLPLVLAIVFIAIANGWKIPLPQWLTTGLNYAAGLICALSVLAAIGFALLDWFVMRKQGKSVGKQWLGLQIVRADGRPCDWWTYFSREYARLISTFLLGIGYLLPLFNSRQQSIHDAYAKTYVIRDPARVPDPGSSRRPLLALGVVALCAAVLIGINFGNLRTYFRELATQAGQENRVEAFLDRGDPEGALREADRAAAAGNDTASLHQLRGAAYYALGRHQEGIRELDAAIQKGPVNSGLYSDRGLMELAGRLEERAWADFNEAIRLRGKNPDAYYGRAQLYARHGHYQDAIQDFDIAIVFADSRADLYVGRANAHMQLKQYKDALSDYQEALRLSPDDAGALLGAGTAYEALGQTSDAANCYLKLLHTAAPSQQERSEAEARLKRLGVTSSTVVPEAPAGTTVSA